MRLPRPLITWKIFDEPPPTSWPNPLQAQGSARFAEAAAHVLERNKRKPRREPAEANSTEHDLYPAGERIRADKDFLNQQWANEQSGQIQTLADGCFYIVKLEVGSKDEPWMAMGLVQVRREAEEQQFYWFCRSSQGQNPWPTPVTFKPWPGPGTKQGHTRADADVAMFQITPEWLPNVADACTDGAPGNASNCPLGTRGTLTVNSEYRRRLELFGRIHGLVNENALRAKAARGAASNRGTHASGVGASAEPLPRMARGRGKAPQVQPRPATQSATGMESTHCSRQQGLPPIVQGGASSDKVVDVDPAMRPEAHSGRRGGQRDLRGRVGVGGGTRSGRAGGRGGMRKL